ncbi:MAG: hypothetical protein GY906_29570, partial [bacterium]|nr:hypothetical protein [bacterium]
MYNQQEMEYTEGDAEDPDDDRDAWGYDDGSNASTKDSSAASTAVSAGGLPNKKLKSRHQKSSARDARRTLLNLERKQKGGDTKYRVTDDPREAMCRKALALYRGSDGDAEIDQVLDNLVEISQDFGGVVLDVGTCRQEVLVALTSKEYRDPKGERRMKLWARVDLDAAIDVPMEVYKNDPQAVVQALVDKVKELADCVLDRLLPALDAYVKGKGVVKISRALKAPDPEALKDLAENEEDGQRHLERDRKVIDRLLERRAGGDASSEEPPSDEEKEDLDQSDKSSHRSMSVESESEIHEGPTVAQSCCLGTKKSKKVPNVAESGGLVGLYFAGLKKLANFCGEVKEISFLGNMKYVYLSREDSQKNLAPFLAKSFADDYLHGMVNLAPVVLHWPMCEGTDKHGAVIEKSCSGPTSAPSEQSKKRRAGKVEGPAKYASAVIENSLFVAPGTTNVTDADVDVVEWGSADWLDKLKFSMTAEELSQRKPVRFQRLIDIDPSGEHAPTITHQQLT